LLMDGATVNHVGALIEDRRRALGLSRRDLAERIGVSKQTILNLERDQTYNIGTRMLRELEGALDAEFTIALKKKKTAMGETIHMGNDEFILHIRKQYDCDLSNPQLGRRIWRWLRDNADGEQVSGQVTAAWGDGIAAVRWNKLPGTATQFRFRLDALPALYRFLGQLGRGDEALDEEGQE